MTIDRTLRGDGPRAAPVVSLSFGEFVAARSVALQRFAYLVTGNAEDAHDAVQEALIGAFPRWERLSGAGDPEGYLRRSIVNAHITAWRRHGRETSVDPSWLATPAPDAFAAVVDARAAVRLCAGLPPRQRAAVVLRFYEDLDYAEIGRICDCTAAAARVLVHRALASLRERLDGEDLR